MVAATLPRYPVVIPGDRVVVDGRILPRPDSPYGSYLERIGAVGTLQSRTLRVEPVPDDPGRRLEAAATRCGRGARPGAARTGGRTRGGHPHRPARRGRSRPRGGLHHRGRQSRGGDLRLEHRDRRGGHRRDERPAGAPSPLGHDHRRDRRLRRLRGRVAIGRARRAHGRCRPARARDRPRGAGERGARLGRDAAAGHGSEPDRRRGLPAVVAGDGRSHRMGDPTDRMDRARRPRPRPALARREPRRVARGAGRDAPDHPRLVRPAGDPVAPRQPRRRPARRTRDGGRPPGAWRVAPSCSRERRRSSARSSRRPAG